MVAEILIYVGMTVCAWGMIWCLITFRRNNQVSKYRNELIQRVGALAQDDINNGRGWEWRWRAYETVSYDEMLRKFWKPLDSFYEDKAFMEDVK